MLKRKILPVLLLLSICSSVHVVRAQDASWAELYSKQVKLDTNALSFCVYVADINNDKYPDIVTIKGAWSVSATNNVRVYMNVHDVTSASPLDRVFVDVTAASGVNAKANYPADSPTRGDLVVALADVNNDGNIDLVRGNYYNATAKPPAYIDRGDRCEVLLGDGQGHFALKANNGLHELGLINPTGFSFLDYDKDGKLDLFIAVWFEEYATAPQTMRAGYLMKGNGDGTFTNVSAAAGITQKEPMYGCSAIDWNNDGWPDIATAPYCRTGGQLWKNNGNGTFTNVASSVGYNAQYMSGDNGQPLCMWSNVPEDFDNDGDMDFIFSLVHGGNSSGEGHSTIVMNSGAANGYKLAWDMPRMTWKQPMSAHQGDYDASWLDFDNDGLEDIALIQGHYGPTTDRLFIFHQKSDNTFMDVTQDMGLIMPQTLDGHLMEALDYDLDGDDDLVFCRNGHPRSLHLVKNKKGQDNNWVGVSLIAPPGVNNNCIGARIHLWAGGVKRMREVYAGRGNDGGQQPFAMLFGLGSNTKIDSIKIEWPEANNRTTIVKNPPINQYITLTQNGLGIEEAAQKAAQNLLKVYPNPASDFILIQLDESNADAGIEIYNLLGQQMKNVVIANNAEATKYCSIKSLPVGNYIVKVTSRDGRILTRPFVKVD